MAMDRKEEQSDCGWAIGNGNADEEGLSNESNASDKM